MKFRKMVWLILLAAIFAIFCRSDGRAETRTPRLTGQTVYVPVYSHIYSGTKNLPFYLTATLSIRNTDFHLPITITAVDYYDSEGGLVKKYITAPVALKGMASMRYIVKETDTTGGSGANFIVRWRSDAAVTPPLMESVMISTKSSQGVSFTSRGQAVEEIFK